MFLPNPLRTRPSGASPDTSAVLGFHTQLPEYAATPLREVPRLARELGLERLFVKDETSRLGLRAFKILGCAWAVYQELCRRLDERPDGAPTTATLSELGQMAAARGLRLVAASSGNHGHALARVSAWAGVDCTILLPLTADHAKRSFIEAEGAEVRLVQGAYDVAIAQAADLAVSDPRVVVIADTTWEGYSQIPSDVLDGYSTVFAELDQALEFDIMAVQIGVGGLAAAAARHCAFLTPRPTLIGVEPATAASSMASAAAGHVVSVPAEENTLLTGLNCGTPSRVAWPHVSSGFDLFAAIDDRLVIEAQRLLHESGIEAGPSGAGGLAALLALRQGDVPPEVVDIAGLSGRTRTLVIVTDGVLTNHGHQQATRTGQEVG